MAANTPRLPLFVVGVVSLVVLLAGCSPRVIAPPEPPYAVRRGDEAFRYEAYDTAIASYRNYLDGTAGDEYTARIFYKTALAEYRLGRYHDSLATLRTLERRYPKGRWVQVDALRGDAARELSRPMVALRAWDEGWSVGNDNDRRKLRQRIVALARTLSDDDLGRARQDVRHNDVRALLERQIAVRHPGIDEPMPDSLASEPPALEWEPDHGAAEATAPLPPPMAEAAAWPSADARVRGQLKVGCLLPLSGRSRELGQRSLRGLQVLFGEHNEELLVMDTGSDAATAVRRFSELSRDPNVVAVIGPLRSADAVAVAPLAHAAQVPLLLLSQRDGLADGSVLQVGVTRSRLVDALLQYAMRQGRLRRFGILYPEDDLGRQYAAAFRSEVERRGGNVVGTDPYSPLTRALSAGTLKRWRTSQHLQAVFLPDDVSAAQAVARVLQRDMPDITLLGIHGWEPIASQEEDRVNGVLFSDGFYSGSTRPGTQQFVEQFRSTYGDIPGALEAEAYDAGLLVQSAIEAGARSRRQVLEALRAHAPIDGATGELAVTPAGVHRQPFLLQVYDGKIEEVRDGAS